MRTLNYHATLTGNKDVNTIEFNGSRYVNFHTTYKKDGDVYDSYINLNDEEWDEFLKAAHEMDKIIPVLNVQPCVECYMQKKVIRVSTNGGRMHPTTLSAEVLDVVRNTNLEAHKQQVKDDEAGVNNVQLFQCEYCGDYKFPIEGVKCHCHGYNCRECEPLNFCVTCGALKVMGI